MHLSMLASVAYLLVFLNGWLLLIICFIIRSNAVLNCELGQASPIKMFYIALQIIIGVTTRANKQASKVDRRISSVGGFAPIMNNYLAKLMVGPRPPQALPQLCH